MRQWIVLALAGLGCAGAGTTSQYRALLDQYCVGCHNERAKVAGLKLDKADLGTVPDGAAVWEKVIRKLRSDAMPPPGLPQPDAAAKHAFVEWLEESIDRAAL